MTSDEYHQLINLKIFKAHYGKIIGDLLAALKPYLIILAVVVIIAVAVSAYNAYTLSRIPAYIVYTTPQPTQPPVVG